MVDVQDVREKLNNISDTKIADETIQINLSSAGVLINRWVSNSSTQEIIDEVILCYAALQSYISYIAKIERGVGVVPPGAQLQLNSFLQQFETARAELIRGNPVAKIPASLIQSRYTLGPI